MVDLTREEIALLRRLLDSPTSYTRGVAQRTADARRGSRRRIVRDGAVARLAALDALAAKVENRALLADALRRADGFMSGFEDDEGQEGVNDALEVIRRALALVA